MSDQIYLAPLQGHTDRIFRNKHQKYYNHIEEYYAPYIRLNKEKEIPKKNKEDLDPDTNQVPKLIPQVLSNNSQDIQKVAKELKGRGYKELNWNIGCPFPMVTRRKLGSGLLEHPETIDKILDSLEGKLELPISIKMRLGHQSPKDIEQILPILNKYKIEKIIIHPRTGKQQYKGEIDLQSFEKIQNQTHHTLCYNGDIKSLDDYKQLTERYPQINHWMIGRGILENPNLAFEIKTQSQETLKERQNKRQSTLKVFHQELYEAYKEKLEGGGLIMKMREFWKYHQSNYPEKKKTLKKLMKTKTTKDYEEIVWQIIH